MTRISESPKEFNIEIVRCDQRLQAIEATSGNHYWQQFGLTSVNASDWHNKRTYWDTPATGLYALYSDPTTSTSVVKGKVHEFIKEFRAFGGPLLDLIAASPNAGTDDERIFNLVLNKNRHHASHTHTKIADACVTEWTGDGQGTKKAASKTSTDSKRHSLAPGADGVQYAYTIMDENPKTIQPRTAAVIAANAAAARAANPSTPTPVPLPLPPQVPQHAQDGTTKEFYSGAIHEFNFGEQHTDKWVCMFSRWYNTKHPTIAGDWNKMQIFKI